MLNYTNTHFSVSIKHIPRRTMIHDNIAINGQGMYIIALRVISPSSPGCNLNKNKTSLQHHHNIEDLKQRVLTEKNV